MRSWTEHPDLVAFYSCHRDRPEDLYPSERKFLPWLARQAASVLDVGCAAGGFVDIWRHYRPDIAYTGVDVSRSLIATARQRHPDVGFAQGNCAEGLSLPSGHADVVQALGVLNWEPRLAETLAELWRLTRRYVFFDVRLIREATAPRRAVQRMALSGSWDGQTTTPYIMLSWPMLVEHLMRLAPGRILGYGYWGKPAETVQGVEGLVCFATFVLEKGTPALARNGPAIALDLPWPGTVQGARELDDVLRNGWEGTP